MNENKIEEKKSIQSRTQMRLKKSIEDRKFYETHQIYKTLAFRSLNKKEYLQAIKTLKEGSEFLLSVGEYQSGTDLACMIVNVFNKHNQPFTKLDLTMLCDLLGKMKVQSDERSNFIEKVYDLISNNLALKSAYNEYLGKKYWQEKSFSQSRRCIIATNNGYLTGAFLVELQTLYSVDSEIDLILVQAVLQYLCLKQPNAANITYYTYTKSHPKLTPGPPYQNYPLLNFLWLILLSVQHSYKGSVFSILRERYEPHLKRDEDFSVYLDKIACIYFGFRPAEPTGPPNIFGNLMNMLDLGGLDNLFNSGESLSTDQALTYEDVE